jgi:hypothetical protein
MTSQQLEEGQREARMVTRTAYGNRMVTTQEFGTITVMPSGDAYTTTNGVMRRIGVVGRNGKSEFLRVEGQGLKGKAARRAEKRARQRARLAGASAATHVSNGRRDAGSQADQRAAAPASYSMGGGGR